MASGCGDDDGGGADAGLHPDAAGDPADAAVDAAIALDPRAAPVVSVDASITDVAVAADGSTYLVGALSAPYDFGDGPVTPTGSSDILVVKYEPDGALDWVKHWGGSDYNRAEAVGVDAAGNVYVTGTLRGSADFGGGLEGADPGTGSDVFVASFTPAGAYRWAEVFASADGHVDEGNGLAVGADHVYVAGRVGRGMDLGGGSLGNMVDRGYFFNAAFDKDTGLHVWSQGFAYDSTGYFEVTDLAIDSGERLYISGQFRGEADLGNGTVRSSELTLGDTTLKTETGFVVSYGATGAFRWQKLQDGENSDHTLALTVDADDNVYAVGTYTSSAELGGGSVNDSEATSIPTNFFAVSYSNTGGYRFHQAGLSLPEERVAISHSSGVVATGDAILVSFQFNGPMRVAGEVLESTPSDVADVSSQDIGLMSLDRETGDLRWTRVFGGGGSDGTGPATSDGANPLVVVRPEGVIEVDDAVIEPEGSANTVLLRITE